ncbi:hypothetical protein GCM10027418_29890 [Mariniluteicoccus endophyticus]
MGEEIGRTEYTEADFARYREVAAAELDQLRRMLVEHPFEEANPRAGMEVELNLVDRALEPSSSNDQVLKAINDPAFVTELGEFNIEMNLAPFQLGPKGLSTFEHTLCSHFSDAASRAARLDVSLAAIGILPTLGREHLTGELLSDNPRYTVLDDQMRRLRGGRPAELRISGAEALEWDVDTIAPESACTSHQVHLQVAPNAFPALWNASQAIAGVQLALGANSPFFLGRHLWAETRIPVFTQASDVRTTAQMAAGERERVFFGERWISSFADLFEENQDWFEPILPDLDDPDADEEVPSLRALALLNGTVYRWNRPVYDVAGGTAHVRVENRVLPAGPTMVDMVANAAFYAGLTRALATQDHPVWADEPFAAAADNFRAGARDGIHARLTWPGLGESAATDLVARTLLPLAAAGLEMWGVAHDDISRYLGVVEGRCAARTNGADWQVRAVAAREAAGESRAAALRGMLGDYLSLMDTNEPVHTWEDPA